MILLVNPEERRVMYENKTFESILQLFSDFLILENNEITLNNNTITTSLQGILKIYEILISSPENEQ